MKLLFKCVHSGNRSYLTSMCYKRDIGGSIFYFWTFKTLEKTVKNVRWCHFRLSWQYEESVCFTSAAATLRATLTLWMSLQSNIQDRQKKEKSVNATSAVIYTNHWNNIVWTFKHFANIYFYLFKRKKRSGIESNFAVFLLNK